MLTMTNRTGSTMVTDIHAEMGARRTPDATRSRPTWSCATSPQPAAAGGGGVRPRVGDVPLHMPNSVGDASRGHLHHRARRRGDPAEDEGPARAARPAPLAATALLTAGVLTAWPRPRRDQRGAGLVERLDVETFTVHAAEIPRVARPAVRAHAQPRIAWKAVRIAEDVPVQRYVVTRHLGTVTQVACDVPATARPRCIDRFAPAGYRATYTVTARHGAHWRATDSEASAVVTMTGVAVPIWVTASDLAGAAGTPSWWARASAAAEAVSAPPQCRSRPRRARRAPPIDVIASRRPWSCRPAPVPRSPRSRSP